MPLLACYADFIARVTELGFMPMGDILPGLPSLGAETSNRQWHTGEVETDPWRWKDRAAEEKALAYGCVLGGHKGFIAPHLYGLFFTACRPAQELEELWDTGQLNQTVWKLWQLFDKSPLLDTAGIRKQLGVTKGHGAARIDAAVRDLQRDFYLSVSGSRQRTGRDGQPYGWFINTYARTLDWAPPEWLEPYAFTSQPTARRAILDHVQTRFPAVDYALFTRTLGWST